jgi:uncharacterized membrane protein YdbT with pleckstrin-like domain
MKDLIFFALLLIVWLLIDLVEISRFDSLPEEQKQTIIAQQEKDELNREKMAELRDQELNALVETPFSEIENTEDAVNWVVAQTTRTMTGNVIATAIFVALLAPMLISIKNKFEQGY